MTFDPSTEIGDMERLVQEDVALARDPAALLAHTTVRRCFDPRPITIRAEANLQTFLWQTSMYRQSEFPVLSADGRFLGMVARDAVLEALEIGDDLCRVLIAADLIRIEDNRVTPDDSLLIVLRRFHAQDGDWLPVVEVNDPDRLVGVLSRQDLLAACRRELIQDEN